MEIGKKHEPKIEEHEIVTKHEPEPELKEHDVDNGNLVAGGELFEHQVVCVDDEPVKEDFGVTQKDEGRVEMILEMINEEGERAN